MDIKVKGFSRFLITQKDLVNLDKSKYVLKLKDNLYLEIEEEKEHTKHALIYLIIKEKDKLYSLITEINFDKEYSLKEIKEIKENKEYIVKEINSKKDDSNYNFGGESSYPYGIFSFK